MKLRLQREHCVGHAQCYGVNQDMFPLDDSGYSSLTATEIAPQDVETARAGAGACPERALVLDED